ncbi:MAG: aminopeptidase P N-terminal domain-containing protein [bacterium]
MSTQHGFPYYQKCFEAEEFKRRHAHMYEALGRESVAVLKGAGPSAGFEIFRQTNDFFYLTGVEVPQAYLLLDGRTRNAILYLPYGDTKQASIEGAEPVAEDRDRLLPLTGCDDVRGIEALEGDLRGARIIYTPHAPAEGWRACQDTLRCQARLIQADPWDHRPSQEEHFIGLLAKRIPEAEIRDLSPILFAMRSLKSAAELKVMRRAGELSVLAVCEAMRRTRPGLFEYQLGALADAVFVSHGARGAGYRPIIAAGKNIWFMHYFRNNCTLNAGDLVLMDYAPDLCNYTSDIGRMWPVSGTYSPVQRELYGFVVAYHQALLAVLRPGVLPAQMLQEAAAAMEPALRTTRFSKPIYEQAARRLLASDKALTHPVGMAVHDCCSYINTSEPLQPGLVFALDPQLWVPEEQLYIRVEDTVAITETGVENLTAAAPHALDEIEALVRSGCAAEAGEKKTRGVRAERRGA